MQEVTFELILIGECEIQQTKPTGRGKSLWKASKVKKRLKGQELQRFGMSGGLGAFRRKMGLERPAATS